MDDLLADFVAETREMLQAIEGEIVAWEADPADRERLDAIFRFVHTVKGNCGFFDFPRLEKLSHAAESALSEVRAGQRKASSGLVSGVLAVIDRIGDMVEAIDAGEPLPEGGDELLVAALEPNGEEPDSEALRSEGETGQRAARAASGTRSIRLPVELLDRMMVGVSDMVLARNELARRLREQGADPALEAPFERLSSILDSVREGATRMRMQRLEHLFGTLPRMVRDLSAELGKQVMIDLDGGDVELDREMIESVRDPLTHILRNAIDHGIEPPSERIAAGKREIGTITVSARRTGNRIVVAVSDDGRGIALDRLREKAVAAGILGQAEAAALGEEATLDLIFAPGFSTADAVSQVSGRGVGMDVVRANIERIGGSVTVSSKAGQGTIVYLYVPLTLSIVEGLTVRVGEHTLGLPRSYIVEIARSVSRAISVDRLGDGIFLTFRDQRVPCLDLAEVLDLDAPVDLERATFVFLRLVSGDLFALAVDRVLDNEDFVLKPLPPALEEIGLFGGTALLDDGQPILKLDVPALAERHGLAGPGRVRAKVEEPAQAPIQAQAQHIVVFEGFDGRRLGLRMQPIRHIHTVPVSAIERTGSAMLANVDGAILPLTGIDAVPQERETIIALRLSDGEAELLHAARAIVDTVELGEDVVPLDGDNALEGSVLVEGRIVGLVDTHRLFARHGRRAVTTRRPTCRIPAGDAWATGFLAPLLQGAGYDVLGDGDPRPADVAVVLDESAPGAAAGRILRLRSRPEPSNDAPDSIYRYDRDGLLSALAGTHAKGA
ncbi:chemotaxis protein CheA [Pelagerythrobacter marinus]|uniref:chemotaxis protein CheA n=1 Tax=Pelagerythrobacter marinus TaxID=538382 RepID=UPI002036A19C|nr:chemotaxis protein CheA [Pelagerythrobacter marinus]USA39819.1 chemotaxis protein CheA [Pelagerythrobacter marinus]WPZ06050.1 chemotaxis protein CheA [Pelagerythrobacter marinus]